MNFTKFSFTIEIQVKIFTEEHADVSRTLTNMARIYLDMGEMLKSLEFNERALGREKLFYSESPIFHLLDINMKLYKTEEHADVVTNLYNMAMAYSGLGQNTKALEMNERVYSREKNFILSNVKLVIFSF